MLEKQTPLGAELGGKSPRGADTVQGSPVRSAVYSTPRSRHQRGGHQAAQAALGKTTESSGGVGSAGTEKRRANRSERFAMQRHVWRLLPGRRRLQACHTMAAQTGRNSYADIEIRARIGEDGSCSCHYGGVARCASVWVCPVCAPAIAKRRAGEISQARQAWESEGGQVLLVSLTFAHSRSDQLADNVAGLRKARERMRGRKAFKELRKRAGMVGHIAALEVTYGEANGWHPHLHEYWFVGAEVTPAEIQAELYGDWAACCEKEGLGRPSRSHGFDVRPVHSDKGDAYAVQGNDLASTIDRELSGGLSKRGRGQNHSMWELLLLSMGGDSRAGRLWVEFAETLMGRAALFWSQGLKARFAIGELSDEQAAEEEETAGVTVCRVPSWHLVRRYRKRADLLVAAETGGQAAVAAFVADLQRRADAELRRAMEERWRWRRM